MVNSQIKRHLLVGDIQGCYTGLRLVLDKAKFDPNTDCLWSVGDIVNRGRESFEVLDFLYNLPHKRLVLGNHDIYLLYLWHKRHKNKIIKEKELKKIINHPLASIMLGWLEKQPFVYKEEIDNKIHVMAHAGIMPEWSLNYALERSRMLSLFIQSLSDEDWSLIWGDEPSFQTSNMSFSELMLFSINAFTRMRFVNAQGQIDIENKGDIENVRGNFKPWYFFKKQFDCDYFYFGHWAALRGNLGKYKSIYDAKLNAMDNGYIWGGSLKLIELKTQTVYIEKYIKRKR